MASNIGQNISRDYYAINSLNSFSFGTATDSSRTSSPHSPSSRPPTSDEDYDSEEAERRNRIQDVTPRPSVAYPNSRSHPSQAVPPMPLYLQRQSDAASTHTFGGSSSSRSSMEHNGSMASGAVADYEFSSEEDEEDEYFYQGDRGDDSVIDIEISSAVYDNASASHEHWDMAVHSDLPTSQRDREDSLATLKAGLSSSMAPPPPSSPSAPRAPAPEPVPPPVLHDWSAELGDWTRNLQGGITNFSLDTDDIVAASPLTPSNNTQRRSSAVRIGIPWFSGSSGNNNGRRPSTATVTSISTVNFDSWNIGLKAWSGDKDIQERKDWTFKKDKADSSSGLSPTVSRSTMGGDPVNKPKSLLAPRLSVSHPDPHTTPSAEKLPWRGMAINAQEIWGNRHTGRYKVDRRILIPGNTAKPPQQRIDVSAYRDPYFMSDGPQIHEGPVATIHKHSKVAAFSVSRSYKLRPLVIRGAAPGKISLGVPRDSVSSTSTKRPSTSTDYPRPPPSRDGNQSIMSSSTSTTITPNRNINPTATTSSSMTVSASRAGGAAGGKMILLAQRKVQVAFTSTTTTRNLMSHGLLDDSRGARSTRSGGPVVRNGRSGTSGPSSTKREKEKEYKKEKRKVEDAILGTGPASVLSSKKEKEKEKKNRDKGKATPNSSFGSVSSSTSASTSSSASSSRHTYPPPPPPPPPPRPASSSYTGNGTATFSYKPDLDSSSYSSSQRRRHRRRSLGSEYDEEEEEIDDSDTYDSDSTPWRRKPFKTSHAETYGTIDPTALEALGPHPHHQRSTSPHSSSISSGTSSISDSLFRKFFSPSGYNPPSLNPLANRDLETYTYTPPWLIMASRDKQEEQAKVVETLNASFKDVGLLPSTQKNSASSSMHGSRNGVSSGSRSGDSRRRRSVSATTSYTSDDSRRRRRGQRNGRGGDSWIPSSSEGDDAEEEGLDIFADIPTESLFMLLPMWPGETDPVTERHGVVAGREIPSDNRQYLLVYYKPIPTVNSPPPPLPTSSLSVPVPPISEKDGKKEKKRRDKEKDKESPTSSSSTTSGDSSHRHRSSSSAKPTSSRSSDRTTILLRSFSITARIILYHELQGSGLRLPEEGLSVVGDLDQAWDMMPGERDAGGGAGNRKLGEPTNLAPASAPSADPGVGDVKPGMTDWVIGACHSRDAGIEFDSHGLARLGLCSEKKDADEEEEEELMEEEEVGAEDVEFASGGEHGERIEINVSGAGGGTVSTKRLVSASDKKRRANAIPREGLEGEDAEEKEPRWELTQVGKAVTEMVWLGALALTSFGNITQ